MKNKKDFKIELIMGEEELKAWSVKKGRVYYFSKH